MNEVWKKIREFENYEVSNLGNVRSLDLEILTKNGKIRHFSGKVLKQNSRGDGYKLIGLHKNKKQYLKSVHRLVAEAFVPNPNNYHIVNHINEIKDDNRAENLEWVTTQENVNHSRKLHPERLNTISILLYDLEGNFVKKWNSITEASEYYGLSKSAISECLRGNSKMCVLSIWKYYYDDNYSQKIEGYVRSSKYRKVLQYDLFGNFIREWDSIIEVENELGVTIRNITDCCRKVTNSSGKYVWRFYESNYPLKIETEYKRVLLYDFEGNLINVYNNPLEAAISINKPNNQGSITGCCKGKRKTAYGYIWKYENE